MTRSLDEIEVTFDPEEDIWDGHAEVMVMWAASYALRDEEVAAEFGFPSEAEYLRSAVFVAGLLGRLACAAYPWIALSAQQHDCRGWWEPPTEKTRWDKDPSFCGDGCRLSSHSVFNPLPDINEDSGIDMRGQVELFLTVPPEDARVWLDRIHIWLQALAEPIT